MDDMSAPDRVGFQLRKRPLFKKVAQKFLLLWACGAANSTVQINKVFLLLFVHKKKAFLFAQ
jgi:hypothetical protein